MTRARSLSKLVNASTFTVDSSNNIGVNSTSPGTKLDINGNTRLGDNNKVQFGAGNDLEIYHDGSNSYIADTGTGKLFIRGNSQLVLESNNGENYLAANENGDVHLYWDGGVRISTKSDGANVVGEMECDSLDVDGAADITGNVTLHANLDLQDNDKLLLGTSDDIELFHSGAASFLYNKTGHLYIDTQVSSGQIAFTSNDVSEYMIKAVRDAQVELYYNGSEKLGTKSDGVNITGELECDSLDVDGTADITGNVQLHSNVYFPDNDQAIFGNGPDLLIYHNGGQVNNNYIDNINGALYVRNTADNEDILLQSDNGIGGLATYIQCDGSSGAVLLHHYGSEKFTTTSSGVDVTGVLNASGIITAQAGAVAEIGTLSDGATVTPDLATHCNFTITLGGNRTLANPSNVVAGQSGSIFVVQDGTGGRSFNSFGSYWDFIGGTVPTFTSTAGAVDRLDYIVRSSTKIHVVFTANYS